MIRRGILAAHVGAALGSVAIVGASGVPVAQAQTVVVSYAIPGGNLGPALTRWARASDVTLLASAEELKGHRTSGVSGAYAPHEALETLLAGTGLRYAVSGSTVTISGSVGAGNAGAVSADGSVQLETINVTGAGNRFMPSYGGDVPFTTPAAVSSITGSSIVEQNGGDARGIARQGAGTFTLDSYAGSGLAVNIRGMEGQGRVAMSVDGVRQNSQLLTHYQPGNLLHIAPGLIGGVDVQRGSASDTAGFGALTGSFNVRTIDINDVVKAGNRWGGSVTTTYGDNGHGFSTTLAAGAKLTDEVSIMGAITRVDQPQYKSAPYETGPNAGRRMLVESSANDIRSGLFKIDYTPDDIHALRISGVAHEAYANLRGGGIKFSNNSIALRYNYTPDNNFFDTRFHGYYNYGGNEYIAGGNKGVQVENKSFGLELTNRSTLPFGDESVYLDYGGALFGDDVVNSKASGRVYFGDGRRLTGGAFIDATTKLGIFTVKGGLRYDIYSIKGLGGPTVRNGPVDLAVEVDTFESALNPSILVSAQVLPWLQPYVSYGSTYRAPTVAETLMAEIHGNFTDQLTNPFLKGERSRGWEAGFNVMKSDVLFPNDSFLMKVNYFSKDIENFIRGERQNMSFENVPGVTPTYGVEIEGRYDAGFAYIGGSYTNSRTETPVSHWQNSFPYANPMALPEEYYTVDAGIRLLDQRLVVGGRMKYVSETLRAQVASTRKDRVPGYTLFDAYASYKISDDASAFLNIENVADTFYLPAVNASIQGARPGRGRTISAGLKLSF